MKLYELIAFERERFISYKTVSYTTVILAHLNLGILIVVGLSLSGGRCKDILEARCKTVSSFLNVDDMSRMMGVMAMMGRGEDTG